ncbi:DUF4232 domain-containing protein [Streptomyces sp. NPDC004330]|uniref:DUF4232 domain-containing protein n=1 Tax=Streptomyces sp. NPDC004330 TaxID=3364700 RepID=UPI0036C3BB35
MNSKTAGYGALRRGLRGALLGATVATALLTLTACQGDDQAAAPPTATPSGSASAGGSGPGPSASTGDSGTGSTGPTATATGDSGETGGGNGTEYPDCEADGLTTAVELQDERGETPRHFLLTVTNGAKTPCVLNDAPVLRLTAGDDAPIVDPLGEPDTEPVVVEGGRQGLRGAVRLRERRGRRGAVRPVRPLHRDPGRGRGDRTARHAGLRPARRPRHGLRRRRRPRERLGRHRGPRDAADHPALSGGTRPGPDGPGIPPVRPRCPRSGRRPGRSDLPSSP